MQFGKFPLAGCEGGILAHTLRLSNSVLKKGSVLSAADIVRIRADGIKTLVVAKLDLDDIGEDKAAQAIAEALDIDGIDTNGAGTGRVNFHAKASGLFIVSKKIVDRINAIEPGITFATLANHEPVQKGRMVATIKIIPYGVNRQSVEMAKDCAAIGEAMSVRSYVPRHVGVISTLLPGLKDKTIDKTLKVLERRLSESGSSVVVHEKCDHTEDGVQKAIEAVKAECDFIIIFGASAISDIEDVIPVGLKRAGGEVLRFGMPVDPGNLLMLGKLGEVPVLGAPGCARSPAENGFDFILNRLLANIPITSSDISQMGVGGLLMEIGSRPQPRQLSENSEINLAAIILAGGKSTRMGAENKLLQPADGKPMIRHVVEATGKAEFAKRLVVTGHEAEQIQDALKGENVQFVHNPDFAEGLSTSLRAGIRALDPNISHAMILLGDMPGIDSSMIGKFIEAAKTSKGNAILMATNKNKRGNPVLWPKAYFEDLMKISGDTGARHIIGQNLEQVKEIEIGEAASLDLDTPQALEAYRGRSID